MTFLLFILAAGNTVYLFTRFRRYDMQLRSVNRLKLACHLLTGVQAQEPVHSPHASPIPAPRPPSNEDDVFTASSDTKEKSKPLNVAGHVVVTVVKWAL